MPGFLIDLDGTIYAGTRPISHAAEFIEWLRSRDFPYLFVTNNSSRRPEQVAEHLRSVAGVPARPEDVFTSAQAACRYVTQQKADARVYLIGEEGLVSAADQAGLIRCDDGEGTDGYTEPAPDFVVQGIDRGINYRKLELAVRYLLRGARFVLTNPDRLYPLEDGFSPGAGSIGAAIAASSGTDPVVIGKPSPLMMQYALERLGANPGDVWVVGDNLRTDIGGGIAAGLRTALVLTGVTNEENLEEQMAETGIRPDFVCRHLTELAEWLERNNDKC